MWICKSKAVHQPVTFLISGKTLSSTKQHINTPEIHIFTYKYTTQRGAHQLACNLHEAFQVCVRRRILRCVSVCECVYSRVNIQTSVLLPIELQNVVFAFILPGQRKTSQPVMSRLTEEMVIARSKQSDLSTIKKLNCW